VPSATRGISNCAGTESTTAGVKGSATALGLFVTDTLKVNDNTYFTMAGRYNQTTVRNTITDYLDDAGDPLTTPIQFAEEKFTYRKFNPSLGVSHKLDGNYTFFGNWSQSNRAPTVIELGCADPANPCQLPTGLQADPYLKQVVAQTIEGGIRLKSNDYSMALSVYKTDKTRYQGVDISVQKTWGDFRMSTSYSYLKATYQATGEVLAGEREMNITPGMRLPGLPLNTLKMNLDWQATPHWNWGAGIQYSSSLVTQCNEDGIIGEDPNGDLSIKGYALLNLKASYQASKGLTFFGKINNATNKRYETYGMVGVNNFTPSGDLIDNGEPTVAKFVAPGAPRTYIVGMRYQF
jgi:outer membrane receptor protein involved in Fe transport